jgi:hypothetical protein
MKDQQENKRSGDDPERTSPPHATSPRSGQRSERAATNTNVRRMNHCLRLSRLFLIASGRRCRPPVASVLDPRRDCCLARDKQSPAAFGTQTLNEGGSCDEEQGLAGARPSEEFRGFVFSRPDEGRRRRRSIRRRFPVDHKGLLLRGLGDLHGFVMSRRRFRRSRVRSSYPRSSLERKALLSQRRKIPAIREPSVRNRPWTARAATCLNEPLWIGQSSDGTWSPFLKYSV